MRLLADENAPGAAVALLWQHGHDVAWIRMDSPGVDEQTVIARAVAELRFSSFRPRARPLLEEHGGRDAEERRQVPDAVIAEWPPAGKEV